MLFSKKFELLLPWYLTGTLSDSERAFVTAYLQAHPEEEGRLQWDTSMRRAIEKQASELPDDLGLDRALSSIFGGEADAVREQFEQSRRQVSREPTPSTQQSRRQVSREPTPSTQLQDEPSSDSDALDQ